jgi:hypothetical protein
LTRCRKPSLGGFFYSLVSRTEPTYNMMDQDIIIDAITKHLNMLETYVSFMVLTAVPAVWAGVSDSRQIKAFGIKLHRRYAFWGLAVLYLLTNTVILFLFLRIGDLVLLLDSSHIVKGFSALVTNPWVLNPFSYFGDRFTAKFHSPGGYLLLIVIWWVCNTSLWTLLDEKRDRRAWLLLGLFLLLGVLSILSINRAYRVALDGLGANAPELWADAGKGVWNRTVGCWLGALIGAGVFAATLRMTSVKGRLTNP